MPKKVEMTGTMSITPDSSGTPDAILLFDNYWKACQHRGARKGVKGFLRDHCGPHSGHRVDVAPTILRPLQLEPRPGAESMDEVSICPDYFQGGFSIPTDLRDSGRL